MAKALTVKAIEALRPGASRREIGDGGSPGLYLVLQPSGARSWTYRFRSPVDGRPKKFTIGPLPGVSLAEARTRAGELRIAVQRGNDPAEAKRAARAKARDTSHDVGKLLDIFTERYVEGLRPTTARLLRQQIEAELRPAWGRRKIETITRADVTAVLDRMIARGAPVGANRVLTLVRLFMRWCVGRGVIATSPVEGMRKPASETTRDRVLSDDELRAIWRAAGDLGAFGACVRLLILTGQRRMEVGGMRWSELQRDGANPTWIIPPTRTKNGRENAVPLTATALAILDGIPRIEGSDLVFTTDGETISSGWSKNKRRLDARLAAMAQDGGDAVEAWTLHDARRTAASGLARLRQPPHIVEAVLNHRSGVVSGVAAVYNRHSYADEKRSALEAWEGFVLAVCEGRGGNVVAFAR